ncbi:hypothetical protein BH10ACI1_BH10ACI1_24690 [soil metagenome]
MQGRFYLKQKNDSDALNKAIKFFTDAKDLDQNYAKAWAGLADAYISQSTPGINGAITPEKAVRLAKPAANKALELDNTLSEAYNSLGLISSKYEWKWNDAESNFRMAISRNSEFLPAHFGLISVLIMQGRFDEALEEVKKIKEIDPLSNSADLETAKIYYMKQDYGQSDKILSDLLERVPDYKRAMYLRSYQFLTTGKIKEAIELLESMYKSDNEADKVFAAAPLGFAYAKVGRRAEALKIISDLGKFRKNNYVPAQEKALIYVGLGDYEKVFENLRQSCDEKFYALPSWTIDPVVDEVKSDPRFAEIKKCVNLSS